MNRNELERILTRIGQVKALLIGDLCLDVYWSADMTRSHLSRETAHFPLPVVQERMSPGGGGNAANCMAALAPGQLRILGVTGRDWRGKTLRGLLPDASGVVVSDTYRTNAYIKPMRFGYSGEETEDPRIDFENYAPLNADDEAALLANLHRFAQEADVICVSDQMEFGCVTEKIREAINETALKKPVLVDSRFRISLYRNALLKPNEIECARALGLEENALKDGADEDKLTDAAKALAEKCDSRICLTLGARGSLFYNGSVTRVPCVPVEPPVDIVGAGDCYLSALALALAAGADEKCACEIASLASAVTVKKIGTTGTAARDEILNLFEEKQL